ncbi:TonB-linked outer membrane protein, SusC/RagA family [Bacteroidales bacterium Barb6XT]|nr:TonB-linked outer membrane protein, SusC/RagA family [Bacteroidales bacterium Barb6XT]
MISYAGMVTQEAAVQASVRVVLQSDTRNLDEVIVVAYGTTKKSSFAGAATADDAKVTGDKSYTTFEFEAKASGSYYLGVCASPLLYPDGNYSLFDVFVNGTKTSEQVTFTKGDWQVTVFPEKVNVEKGLNTISFPSARREKEEIPAIEFIKLSLDAAKLSVDYLLSSSEKPDGYLVTAKANSSDPADKGEQTSDSLSIGASQLQADPEKEYLSAIKSDDGIPDAYRVSLLVVESGRIKGGEGLYLHDTEAHVEAVPDYGYRFVMWRNAAGDNISVANPYKFVVKEDTELTAVFQRNDKEAGDEIKSAGSTSTDAILAGTFRVYGYAGGITVEAFGQGIGFASVYTLSGRLIAKRTVSGRTDIAVPAGAYAVNVGGAVYKIQVK